MQQTMASSPAFDQVNKFEGSVAEEMKQKAVLAMGLSFIAMIIYLWFRFERVVYGLALVLAVIHDCLLVLGMIAVGAYAAKYLPFTRYLGLGSEQGARLARGERPAIGDTAAHIEDARVQLAEIEAKLDRSARLWEREWASIGLRAVVRLLAPLRHGDPRAEDDRFGSAPCGWRERKVFPLLALDHAHETERMHGHKGRAVTTGLRYAGDKIASGDGHS